jgi:hypothetical protein
VVPPSAWWIGPGVALATQRPSEYHAVAQGVKRVLKGRSERYKVAVALSERLLGRNSHA